MNIDERLEKLTERHEAMAQSMELMILEGNQRAAEWNERFTKLVGIVEKLADSTEHVVASVNKLTQIAGIHERRLDRIEGV